MKASALVALSVANLEQALEQSHSVDIISEALKLEKEKTDTRSTAVEALEQALERAEEQALEQELEQEYKVAEGKAITSKRGIIAHPGRVEKKDVHGGRATLDALVERGLLVK